MTFFNNIKVGTKIFSGFLIILVLMGIVGGLAIFQFSQIKLTITNLADNFAKDQHLADQMVVRILLTRFYANKYIRGDKAEDLARFNEEFAYFEGLLSEASIEITKAERVKMLTDIKAGVDNYSDNFAKVIQLIDKRHEILSKILNFQGPLAEKKLEQLRDSAFQADDAIASFYAGNAQRALLLMRLDAFKYFEEGDKQWVKKFDERYQEFQVAFQKLDQELQDPKRRQLAEIAQTSIEKYRQGFISLQAGYNKQNQIIETQLNVIGSQVRKTASKMSDSVAVDFDATNQKTHILVNQTRWQLFITMLVALLVGLTLAWFISRSITTPLTTVIDMANKIAVGDMSQMVNTQNRYEIEQITKRSDEMGNIGKAVDTLTLSFKKMIEDIVKVSHGLTSGNLKITPQAEYQGDFAQIKIALETSLTDLTKIITDIVQVSQGLAEGIQVTTQTEYRGDFSQIKTALESAATQLAEITTKNKVQDWLKTGQTQLNGQITGEQDIATVTKKIITFLTTYVEAQVGLFYLLKETDGQQYLQLVASYAYVKPDKLPSKHFLTKGLVGQAALERKVISVTQTPTESPPIICSGLAGTLPRHVLLLPFLYEDKVKGVIEIGSTKIMTAIAREFLEQVMPNIGIAINMTESRGQMQTLLRQSQQQAFELKTKQAELEAYNTKLQTQSNELEEQQEALRQTNESLEERTKDLELQKTAVQEKNLALEQTKLEMEKTQTAIETKAKELELASKYKSEFLANMSHELRTPLNSLLILAQLLADNKSGNLDEKQVKYAQTIHSAGNDLLTLINEILDLSKVESGKIELQREEVSLANLLQIIEQKFRHVAADKGLSFQCDSAADLPAMLHTDAQRVEQIINNLLSNAFKFTREGVVKVIIQRSTIIPELLLLSESQLELGKIITISVVDSGIGISKDKQQLIFEAFQQADGSTSRRYGGTGLGLSISRQLARLLGGELTLESVEGKGSTFTLYLPENTPKESLLDKDAEPTVAEEKAPQAASDLTMQHDKEAILKGKKILIVDDDGRNIFALRTILEEYGMRVVVATDGKEVLSKLAANKDIAIVLMDIMMPGMDGYEATRAIRTQPQYRDLPIIALTAKAMKGDKTKCIKAGANDYLAKPVDTEKLISLMRVWLYR